MPGVNTKYKTYAYGSDSDTHAYICTDVTMSLHSVWRRSLGACSRGKRRYFRLPLNLTEQQSPATLAVVCFSPWVLPHHQSLTVWHESWRRTPNTWLPCTHTSNSLIHLGSSFALSDRQPHVPRFKLRGIKEVQVRVQHTRCVQIAYEDALWFLISGESVFFCMDVPWTQEHNTHSFAATPILVKCYYISTFISVPCGLSVPCKHMKTLRIIKLSSYISFSMFKHRN